MTQQNIIIGNADEKAGDTLFSAFTKTQANFTDIYSRLQDNLIVVKQDNIATTLGAEIDSTKVYALDGIIDFTGTGLNIKVPAGGVNIIGQTFDVSKLICSDTGYTMFESVAGGSGDVLGQDYAIEVTGVSSKVYDLFDATGFNAFEFSRINYNNCTSLGEISGYRQGLEVGSGRFGGNPELTLSGTWLGGYFIDTSIVRSINDGAYTLFKAGAGFVMNSRFRSNQNIDLPSLVSFLDFSQANFANPSTLQLEGCIITRDGVSDAGDGNITPNISASNLASSWSRNNGLSNTFEGGSIGVSTESITVISSVGVFVDLAAAAWSTDDLQHFDNPSGNQLRHLGDTPREYKVIADFVIDSASNDVLTLRVTKWNNSAMSFSTVLDQSRQVNSLVGGRDVAFFSVNINTTLDRNDYIKLEVANQSSTSNVTAETDSYYIVEER